MPMDSGAVPVSGHDSSAFSRLAVPCHGVADHAFTGLVDSQLAETCLMFFLLLLLLLFPAPASTDERWFDRHSEGWFWYECIPEPEAKPERAEDDQTITPPAVLPASLSTQWIRKNIGNYLDRAIDEPTKEHVSQYLYLDRFVKEKAERFARVGKQVIESDPMLDENVRRPISPAAAKIKDDMAYQAREAVLKKIAKKAGLVFYYRGNCSLCHVQARTISLLSMEYGFELIPISTDGHPIPELPNSRTEHSPPPTLNILTYPALFLMQPPENIVLIRQGAISFTALTERLVEVAFQQGWIDKNEYLKTRITTETWNIESQPVKQSLNIKPISSHHQP